MSQHPSDPAHIAQFRRRWTGQSAPIRFLSELSEEQLDRLALARGEAVVRALPPALTAPLTPAERATLARAFGRPAIRRLRERGEARPFDGPRRSP